MKQIMLIPAILVITLFSACNSVPEATASEPQVQKQVTPAPPPPNDYFAFMAEDIKITKPLVINHDDVESGGEGGIPVVSVSYTFQFIDRMGNVKEWWMNVEVAKSKPVLSTSEEAQNYKQSLRDFSETQSLYRKITKTQKGKLVIEGNGDMVTRIAGNTGVLWTSPFYER